MLIAEMSNVEKYYGDRLILKVENFKLNSNDRIGVVGLNGSGKTTFLNILTNKVLPDKGNTAIHGSYAYITQLGDEEFEGVDQHTAKRFKVNNSEGNTLSGGENTRLKIAKGFSTGNVLIIGDEPTSNLDREGIELLQKELKRFRGAVLTVSHDRDFLDQVCNSILEIENGEVRLYKGNYTKYKKLKEEEKERSLFEYEQYRSEKLRLEAVIEQKAREIKAIRKTPKRMGNSEARLHKMGNQNAKAKLDRSLKSIVSRIDQLEVKEKPKELPGVNVDIQKTEPLYSKIIFGSDGFSKSFGERAIFEKAVFQVFNGSKTAIMGPNGTGKTTLIKMVVSGDLDINRALGVKVGYFSQNINILDETKSLLDNVMESSVYDGTFVRTLLARLVFKSEDLAKNVGVLSGGERVKTALAKIIVGDYNVLVLDEPTNYLDIHSMEAVEEALIKYRGTVLFVSHDKRFVQNIADHIISIEDKKLVCFDGSLDEYIEKQKLPVKKDNHEDRKAVLQLRLTEIIGRLSMPSKGDNAQLLDEEYKSILSELKKL